MLKKIIALSLICAMLVPLSPAVAADETTVTPTIEEILNSYHEKAFAAQTTEENGGVSTYARGGSSQTLEQETVAELTAAGYEAYNVTGDNYETSEEALHTDFAEMGLEPSSSYVVIVSGEDPASHSNPNTRAIDPPTHDDFGDGSSGHENSFTYTQDGEIYIMRYVTVTSDASDDLRRHTLYTLQEIDELATFTGCTLEALADLTISYIEDKIENSVPIIDGFSFLADWLAARDPEVYIALGDDMFTVHATSVWTLRYIQIWDNDSQTWKTVQSSCYAVSRLTAAGYLYDTSIKDYEWVTTQEVKRTAYSVYYEHSTFCKQRAVTGYLENEPQHDFTGDIYFTFYTIAGTSLMPDESPLFIHFQPTLATIEELGG